MKRILQQLTDPHVRRLAWCLFAEPMANIHCVEHLNLAKWHDSTSLETWLKELDRQPQPLHAYILAGNHRLLGSYFERLWQFFFNFHPQWTLLADHIQVIHDKETLGELDLLVSSPDNETLHIELATKWYLQIPHRTGANTCDWLGPQTKDRLDLKIQKLEEKQFPFAGDAIVTNYLQSQSLPLPDRQVLVMKGGLFAQLESDFTLPSCSPDAFTIHSWCHHAKLKTWIQQDHQYCLLEKHEWLGPARLSQQSHVLNHEQLLQASHDHFTHREYPYAIMVCDLGPTTTTDAHTANDAMEVARIMVVKDSWPN